MFRYFLALVVAAVVSTVYAGDRVEYSNTDQPLCLSGGVEYCKGASQAAVCSLIGGRFKAVYNPGDYYKEEVSGFSCVVKYCNNQSDDEVCNESQYSYVERTFVIYSEIVSDPDPEPDQCEANKNKSFLSILEISAPPIRSCQQGCQANLVDAKNFGVYGAEGQELEYYRIMYTFDGSSCVEGDGNRVPRPNKKIDGRPGSEATYTDAAGMQAQYTTPNLPPEGSEPIASEGTTSSTGTVVEVYDKEGGGKIYVVKNPDGSVEFTDSTPLSTPGVYAASGTSSGGTGVVDNGTSGGFGSESGTGGSGDGQPGEGDGSCTGDDCAKEDEDKGSASGGASCDVAPTCSGKPVECAIVRQAWETRCQTEAVRKLFEEEIPADVLTRSSESKDVLDGIGEAQNIMSNLDGGQADSLVAAATVDGEGDAIMSNVPGTTSCDLPGADIEMMGVQMGFGTKLCQSWGMFRNTGEFAMWCLTVAGVWMQWCGMMIRRS